MPEVTVCPMPNGLPIAMHVIADAQLVGIAEPQRGEVARLDLQHRDVGAGIACRPACAWNCRRSLSVTMICSASLIDVMVGQHVAARGVDDDARAGGLLRVAAARSGRLKKRRKKGSRNSGLSSIGARVTTEMFTTAGVTSFTSGASVGRPRGIRRRWRHAARAARRSQRGRSARAECPEQSHFRIRKRLL